MAKSATASMADENSIGARLKSWPQRTKDFLRDVRTEMKHVTTPSWKEVRATTVVVIISVFLFAAFFWVVDMVIGRGLDAILKYFVK
jgi:preprotein translocase subunit SecE